jgi:DNA-binding NarL/FixJ family response regulator
MSRGILIADDSATIRKIIRAYLTERAFDVCGEAIDGRDAIKKARELEPALVLLDLSMPDINGVEVASILRDSLPHVRILVFTLYSELLSCRPLTTAIGIDAVVAKSEGMSALAESIRALLGSEAARG